MTVEKGLELPGLTVTLKRSDLVRYAGASGDFNPIHYSDRMATALGLPGVVAHGMLTMAEAGRVVTDWLGDPSRLVEYGVRFVRPVPVPDDDAGAELRISAVVASVNDAEGTAEIDISTEIDGQKVLGRARAVVKL
jgi:acyl dehydratase